MNVSFSSQAQAAFDRLTTTERGNLVGLDVEDASRPHPFLAAHWLLSDITDRDAGPRIRIYQASFQHVAEQDPTFDAEAALEREIARQASRHHEDRACADAYKTDDALFAAHAAFRAHRPLLPGWYRQGEVIEPYIWAVDLDVFLELPLRAPEFEALRGTIVTLKLPGTDMELPVPSEAEPDESWHVGGAGLFEEDIGKDPYALEEGETIPGTFGDLHVMPVVW